MGETNQNKTSKELCIFLQYKIHYMIKMGKKERKTYVNTVNKSYRILQEEEKLCVNKKKTKQKNTQQNQSLPLGSWDI